MPFFQQIMMTLVHAAGFGPGPDTISDLQLWLDAYQEVGFSNGDQMSTVQDWSGNNRDGTGAGTSNPRYLSTTGPNSLPCFELAQNGASSAHFNLPNFMSGYTAGHVFVVIKNINGSGTASAVPCPDWGTATDGYYPWDGNGHIYDTFGTNTRKDNITNGVNYDTWHVYECRSASGAWNILQNGSSLFSTGTNTVGFGTAPKIGYESGPGRPQIGYTAEVAFYNRVLSGSEITTIYTYLNNKYGFSL